MSNKALSLIFVLFVIFCVLSISFSKEFYFCQECGAEIDLQKICLCDYSLFETSKITTNAFSCFLDSKHQCKHNKKRFIQGSDYYLLDERHSKGNLFFFHPYISYDQDSPFFDFLTASQKQDPNFRNTILLLLSGQAAYPEWVESEIPPEDELKRHIIEEYEKFICCSNKVLPP